MSVLCNVSCLLQIYCHLSTNEKLSVSCQFFQTCGIINYGSGWREDVVNQCLELVWWLALRPQHITSQTSRRLWVFIGLVTTEPYAPQSFKAHSHVNPLLQPSSLMTANGDRGRGRSQGLPGASCLMDSVPTRRLRQLGADGACGMGLEAN